MTNARATREEETQVERRRRDGHSLNPIKNSKLLNYFRADQLDPLRRYHWFDDDPMRLDEAYQNDWDFVKASDIKGYSPTSRIFNTESDDRIRAQVGITAYGQPAFQYFMSKRKDFDAADRKHNQERAEEALRAGAGNSDDVYVKEVSLGDQSVRRGKVQ